MAWLDRFRRSGAVDPTETKPSAASEGPEAQAQDTAVSVAEARPPAAVDDRCHLGEWLDVDVAEIGLHHNAVERIYDGSLDGMSIRSVFTPAEVAVGVKRARTFSAEFRDHGEQIMFGTALVGADDDRTDYYAGASTINDRMGSLFDTDFVGRIAGVLSTVSGGRPAVVPSEEGRGSYVPATVRFLPPGRGVMHAHTANEFCNVWGAYGHLRQIARMWNSLSYFVVGQAPDGGGELVLYDLMWDDTPADILELGMSQERDDLLARFQTVPRQLAEGDMIVFTGGRIWHRVEPVVGERDRVTIGGFVALSNDGESVYFWS